MLGAIRTLLKRPEEPRDGSHEEPLASQAAVPADFCWSLEVHRGSELVGSIHSRNPMVLISPFREYSVLCGDPEPDYGVWLTNKRSARRAPLAYQASESAWLEFLRQLDPDIDDTLAEVHESVARTTMIDPQGHPINLDSVFEAAFGQS